jgi:hypothetical protein
MWPGGCPSNLLFPAWKQWKDKLKAPVISVPSGNFEIFVLACWHTVQGFLCIIL